MPLKLLRVVRTPGLSKKYAAVFVLPNGRQRTVRCRTVHTILRASDAVSTTSGRPTKMRTVALLEFKRVRAEIHRRGADATADLRSIFEMIG